MNKTFYVTGCNDKSCFLEQTWIPPACSVSVHCLIVFSNLTNFIFAYYFLLFSLILFFYYFFVATLTIANIVVETLNASPSPANSQRKAI